ncbi:S41 family peptidase [Actinophytocola sp.]|uniref:S41 family peptidase n=1 Tax=Actinophytocola sp. TaxID=1872138 RepID=UPI002ED2C988
MTTTAATTTTGADLGVVREIDEFRQFVGHQAGLTTEDRLLLLTQAEVLIRDVYVHLPLKRAMHAIDPVQRLRLLRARTDELDDLAFHAELRDIFNDLRDLHTSYGLPEPYRGIAFLGILVEQFEEGGQPRWLVSKVAEHIVTEPTLRVGSRITHWNGMAMARAVWRNAENEAGSNPPARYVRGLESMTLRAVAGSLPPDEDWVHLRYVTDGTVHETRIGWKVYDKGADILAGSPDPAGLREALRTPLRYQLGVDVRTDVVRRAKKDLFAPAAVLEEQRVAAVGVAERTEEMAQAGVIPTTRPDDLTARVVRTAGGTFGHLRLWTFHMKDRKIVEYLNEVIRLLSTEFPKNGLIIDVRGNGGGFIVAAEFLLQLLTPRRITPEPSQFVCTSSTMELTDVVDSMRPWHASIGQAVSTGAAYSTGLPLSPNDVVNSVGQIYHGPVVLVTDAFCYSATDIFAAGFVDHEIGPVLGVDRNTGAGGANVVRHADLTEDWTGGPLRPLPGGAEMTVSLRRTLRVGEKAGQPVEDLGVVPTSLHAMTENDLLHGNRDLLEAAGALLAGRPARTLDVSVADIDGTTVTFELTTGNVTSVDVYVDGRPVAGPIPGDDTHVTVHLPGATAAVRFEGFSGRELVASRQVRFAPRDPGGVMPVSGWMPLGA